MEYYQKIRNLREDKDYTQTAFAKKLNLERSTYSKYECGTNDIPLNKLDNICNILDVSVDYLFGLSKSKKYKNNHEMSFDKLFTNLKECRINNKFSQEEIANYLDVNQNMVSYYEKGVYIIPIRKLVLFCELNNISIDYILGKIDNPITIKIASKA